MASSESKVREEDLEPEEFLREDFRDDPGREGRREMKGDMVGVASPPLDGRRLGGRRRGVASSSTPSRPWARRSRVRRLLRSRTYSSSVSRAASTLSGLMPTEVRRLEAIVKAQLEGGVTGTVGEFWVGGTGEDRWW